MNHFVELTLPTAVSEMQSRLPAKANLSPFCLEGSFVDGGCETLEYFSK
jgi:hypothetical protein